MNERITDMRFTYPVSPSGALQYNGIFFIDITAIAIFSYSTIVDVSHAGLTHSDTMNGLAKAACGPPPRGNGPHPHCLATDRWSPRPLYYQLTGALSATEPAVYVIYDMIRKHRYQYLRRGTLSANTIQPQLPYGQLSC